MIAQVTPLRRLPPKLDYFDYLVPKEWEEKINHGSLVRVPFRNQSIFGVVVNLKNKSEEEKLKEISGLIPEKLTQQQLELLFYLKDYYRLSIANILKLFVAEPPKTTRKTPAKTYTTSATKIKKVSDTLSQGWFIYDNTPSLLSYINQVCKESNGQTLIVVPEKKELELIQKQFSKILTLPVRSKKTLYWKGWLDSKSEKLILGNLQSLFLPFSNLTQVIVVASENLQYHKAEQSPRLHLPDFLEKFREVYKTNILLTTTSPNIRLYHNFTAKFGKQSLVKPPVTIIDTNVEREKKNYSLFSDQARDSINQSKKTLLYLNKHDTLEAKGAESTTSQQETFEAALKTSGTKKLAEEAKELFPNKKILVYSNLHPQTIDRLKKADILVSTSKILSTDLTFDLAVMVNADIDLLLPNFQAAQNLRRQIKNLNLLADQLLVQTSFVSHYIFKTLDNFKLFYEQELNIRKSFNYPPLEKSYAVIIKGEQHELREIKNRIIQLLPAEKVAGYIQTTEHKKQVYKIFLKGEVDNYIIDNINNNYYNNALIEINPYSFA